jgi:hypothetical protein
MKRSEKEAFYGSSFQHDSRPTRASTDEQGPAGTPTAPLNLFFTPMKLIESAITNQQHRVASHYPKALLCHSQGWRLSPPMAW